MDANTCSPSFWGLVRKKHDDAVDALVYLILGWLARELRSRRYITFDRHLPQREGTVRPSTTILALSISFFGACGAAHAGNSINQQYAGQVMRKAMPEVFCEWQSETPHCHGNVSIVSFDVFADSYVLQGRLDSSPSTINEEEQKYEKELLSIPTYYGFSQDQVSECFHDAKTKRGGDIANNDFTLSCSADLSFYSVQFQLRIKNTF
jgi:hypothetical protein